MNLNKELGNEGHTQKNWPSHKDDIIGRSESAQPIGVAVHSNSMKKLSSERYVASYQKSQTERYIYLFHRTLSPETPASKI